MTQLLHLATPADLDRLLPMIAAFHAMAGTETAEAERRAALVPLLEGSPHGAVWLIGPRMAPVGYAAVSFGWSLAPGGLVAVLDEIWIREKIRGRGMGSEALAALRNALAGAGVRAVHLELAEGNAGAERLCERAGFRRRGVLMAWSA